MSVLESVQDANNKEHNEGEHDDEVGWTQALNKVAFLVVEHIERVRIGIRRGEVEPLLKPVVRLDYFEVGDLHQLANEDYDVRRVRQINQGEVQNDLHLVNHAPDKRQRREQQAVEQEVLRDDDCGDNQNHVRDIVKVFLVNVARNYAHRLFQVSCPA